MNKKILVAIIVIVAVSIAGTVALNMFLAENNLLVPRGPDVEISTETSGHYDSEAGLYYIEGTVENTGKKDANNFRFEVKLYNAVTDLEIKRETVTIGVIPAESSKDVNFTISVPSGLVEVRGQWENTWDP